MRGWRMFLKENFLLKNKTAVDLFHTVASDMPIFDYHCHLNPADISANRQFENMTRLWLEGDHYKWRAMRANGISETLITGNASDAEKFNAWAATVPQCLGNPLFHWTCLELKRPFGISDRLLNEQTASSIYAECNEKLHKAEYSVFGLLQEFKVTHVCTTDDPVDNLEQHKAIKTSGCPTKVYPCFRPDKAMLFNAGTAYRQYLEKLEQTSGIGIRSFADLVSALDKRHEYFHGAGCRLADHGFEDAVYAASGSKSPEALFADVLGGKTLSAGDLEYLQSELFIKIGEMHAGRGWAMQLHLGALRNTNTRMAKLIGADAGFDTIGRSINISKLAAFLDRLDSTDLLPKTILYILNPADNYMAANIIGCFQDGSMAGKIQFGSGWWFNDQKDGMEQQMKSLSLLGLLSKFVGMLTDSRSFVSYSRHEYFRRILCNLVGTWIEDGEIPGDKAIIEPFIRNICYNNALAYFNLP
ncbi:MAG: glucuronate isomerase [Spirochaetales bacterium]|nr:glucuronate isomerase [Spirochaetales bacterium]